MTLDYLRVMAFPGMGIGGFPRMDIQVSYNPISNTLVICFPPMIVSDFR